MSMGKIQNSLQTTGNNAVAAAASASINVALSALLDKENMRKRFEDLLGKRSAQFISSLVTMVNDDKSLQEAFRDNPMSIIKSALRAATYDLPIDPSLGYAYILPFRNNKLGRMEATFILGYKGMNQLALRTGCYKVINVVDVREGELLHYNRLTEEIELAFEEDEAKRDELPIIGFVGYFRLINGTEKTIYMSKQQIESHERRNRKGQYQGKGWREDWNAMAMKTVFRRLIGKWGIMSIDYQTASPSALAAADAIAKGSFDDEDTNTVAIDDTTSEDNIEPSYALHEDLAAEAGEAQTILPGV